jgi:hypothetical protein
MPQAAIGRVPIMGREHRRRSPFHVEMYLFIIKKYEFIFPRGSKMVVR